MIKYLLGFVVVFSLFVVSSPAALAQYSQSTVITGVTFDWSTMRSLAPGSDNFPLTWGSDGHQYTSWGDGGGFGGTNNNRVSLGFARIEGNPGTSSFRNIFGGFNSQCSATFDGKVYGIIDIAGTLYAWRSPGSGPTNYNETRLYRSTNRGCTWTSTNVVFNRSQNVILPSILQFGAGYSGARDNYVYMYATRLKNGSDLVPQVPGEIDLFRVPRDQITNPSAYQYFSGMNGNTPQWTNNLNARQPVFRISTGVGWAPAAVSYNSGLGRYILTVDDASAGRNEVSGRGLGIYEAPNPWGPWARVAVFPNWAEEPTFFYNISNKWTTNAGRTTYLIFSGTGEYDSYNEVRMNFIVANQPSPTPIPTPTRTPSPTPTRTPSPTPAPTSAPGGNNPNEIEVYAAGVGSPTMQILVDDNVVATFPNIGGNPLTRNFIRYSYVPPQAVSVDRIKIAFINDSSSRDLYVDRIVVGNVVYESEASTTYSTGAYSGGKCQFGGGYFRTEKLACNGYFRYAGGSTPTSGPGDADGNGKVDGSDYAIWLANFNLSTNEGARRGDFNNSGRVDESDYAIWLNNYRP